MLVSKKHFDEICDLITAEKRARQDDGGELLSRINRLGMELDGVMSLLGIKRVVEKEDSGMMYVPLTDKTKLVLNDRERCVHG